MMRGDEHDGLVAIVTKRYRWAAGQGSMDIEDIEQEGRIACWQAHLQHKPETGCAYTTLAAWKMRERCRKQMERMTYCVKLPQKSSREAWKAGKPMVVKRASEERLERVSAGNEQDPFRQRLETALAALPVRLAWIVEQRFLEERTLQDVGDELGLSRERVRQLESRALTALRAVMR